MAILSQGDNPAWMMQCGSGCAMTFYETLEEALQALRSHTEGLGPKDYVKRRSDDGSSLPDTPHRAILYSPGWRLWRDR